MGIRIYKDKVKVPGSKFEEYAVLSKLTGQYLIKHMRFIDPIVDDDGNIYPFVRHDHIIFMAGVAISISSLIDFLNAIIIESYSDYPLSIRLNHPNNVGLDRILRSLEFIEVINVKRFNGAEWEITPKSESEGSPWDLFGKMLVESTRKKIKFEDEVVDF